jgi:hypothetical protein
MKARGTEERKEIENSKQSLGWPRVNPKTTGNAQPEELGRHSSQRIDRRRPGNCVSI